VDAPAHPRVSAEEQFSQGCDQDKNWFCLETGHSAQWSVCRDDVGTKTKPRIGTPKFMLIIMWEMNGFRVVQSMTSQNQFNSQYFVEHIIAPLFQTVFPHGRNRRAL
jgi:hypothetical protein